MGFTLWINLRKRRLIRHCEERSDVAIQKFVDIKKLDCRASLAAKGFFAITDCVNKSAFP
ncbi:MAG: hypothetical protein A3J49_17670 [Gallionellales bacterium RIFCSPHIGHO2_02_FULL_57_16]|nr:MAG: hypothetical protein A3J49_17670 [Gallionellales bacterium RIFCSPHIGHO2_02_FULL_57_16]